MNPGVLRGLFGTSKPPITASALKTVLVDGTERLANLGPVALDQIHPRRSLYGVAVMKFDLPDLFMAEQGRIRDVATLSERRTFIRCVRWVLEAAESGERTTVCGSTSLASAVLLASYARMLGDVEMAAAQFQRDRGTRPTQLQLDAAEWALGLP